MLSYPIFELTFGHPNFLCIGSDGNAALLPLIYLVNHRLVLFAIHGYVFFKSSHPGLDGEYGFGGLDTDKAGKTKV